MFLEKSTLVIWLLKLVKLFNAMFLDKSILISLFSAIDKTCNASKSSIPVKFSIFFII